MSPDDRSSVVWNDPKPNKKDWISRSFSGHERNRWFYNQNRDGQRSFVDLSTLSGLDSDADGRGFAIWDYNRDGRVDIALSNANAPHLNLYTNQIQSDNQVIAVRFVGGADSNSSSKFSTRDGYGAIVTLETSDGINIKREFRCGEGFAVQNSDTLLIGIGAAQSVRNLKVRWPSGIEYDTQQIDSGSLVTLWENKEDKATHEIAEYVK